MPKMMIASISGLAIDRMAGRRKGTRKNSTSAPNSPPQTEAAKAAPSARPACPLRAMGKPSITVAAEATVPGTPNSTAGMESEVAVTADSPIRKAIAVTGSIVYVNGSSSVRPTRPPKPGITPSTSPQRTPMHR